MLNRIPPIVGAGCQAGMMLIKDILLIAPIPMKNRDRLSRPTIGNTLVMCSAVYRT